MCRSLALLPIVKQCALGRRAELPKLDQFESVFRAASKAAYSYERLAFANIAVITDLEQAEADALSERVGRFLSVAGDGSEWMAVPADGSETVEQLLGLVERHAPDLLVTYRNLHSAAWRWPHSLGRHLDVLTQATPCPVLVIPHPNNGDLFERAMSHTRAVMAVTDHLAGDSRLVNHAVAFTETGGRLSLTHIEDDATFERYIETISKIPSIDTENARKEILKQLLKEPRDYIRACSKVLAQAAPSIRIEEIVSSGHRLRECKRLIDEHRIELLVMNTKDEEQLAMHGLAYPLAVELREIPLLLL